MVEQIFYDIEINRENPSPAGFRIAEWGFKTRGHIHFTGVDYSYQTNELVCYCSSNRGRLMKREKYGCYWTKYICDHRLYGHQTGCGLTVRYDKDGVKRWLE